MWLLWFFWSTSTFRAGMKQCLLCWNHKGPGCVQQNLQLCQQPLSLIGISPLHLKGALLRGRTASWMWMWNLREISMRCRRGAKNRQHLHCEKRCTFLLPLFWYWLAFKIKSSQTKALKNTNNNKKPCSLNPLLGLLLPTVQIWDEGNWKNRQAPNFLHPHC